MFGGKGGLGNLMKQAQQMQEKMQQMQEEVARLEVTGESGAGLVKVTINGAHNCRRVEIDPSLLEDDKDMLEDLVAAAFNDADAPGAGAYARDVGNRPLRRLPHLHRAGGMQYLQQPSAQGKRPDLRGREPSGYLRYRADRAVFRSLFCADGPPVAA